MFYAIPHASHMIQILLSLLGEKFILNNHLQKYKGKWANNSRVPVHAFVIAVLLLVILPVFQSCQFNINKANTNHEVVSNPFLHDYTYSGKYLDITLDTENPLAGFWKPDGTLFFMAGRYSNNLAMYAVADPWQIHTAQFVMAVDIPGENQHGLYFRKDGKMMWVFDRTSIWTFEMQEEWDISTLTQGINTDLSDFVLRGHDIDFKPDGSILFIDDRTASTVFEVKLTTPWDVSTGILSYTLDISDQQKEVRGLVFINNGYAMMLMDTDRAEILQYNLSDPWDISTAVFFDTFDVSSQTRQGRGLVFSVDENIFYVTGRDEQKVFQYEIIGN